MADAKSSSSSSSPISAGTVWLIGWLFTLGFSHLSFWKGVIAILIWPYYLGVALAG